MLNALLRVMLLLPAHEPDAEERGDRPRVHVARPSIRDMIEDAFRPALRDGTGEIEVALHIGSTLAAIDDALPQAREVCREYARRLAQGVESRIDDPAMRAEFRAAHEATWAARS